MRHLISLFTCLLLASCLRAEQPPAIINPVGDAPRPLRPDSPIDDILDALDARGQAKNLQDFSLDVKLTETAQDTQESTIRGGKVLYQAQGGGRVRATFTTKQINDKITDEKIEYILLDGKLIDRNYARKLENTRRVLRPGQKMNLLKLGEGPFPLPIGQPKDDVHKLFDVKKADASKDDPADTVHLQLKPKPDTEFTRKFSQMDVWVNRNDGFPRRIEVTDVTGNTVRTTDLSDVKLNIGLKDADFAVEKVDPKEWTVHEEDYKE